MTEHNNKPSLFIVMGVSGCGKSSVAKRLALRWGYQMIDADDFHTPQAKAHMALHLPLTDEERDLWIKRLLSFIKEQGTEQGTVLAYSGLKQHHRQQFRELSTTCTFIFLDGDQRLISKRMEERRTHFFPATLLQSQFDALDKPTKNEIDITRFDINVTLDELCDSIINKFEH